MSTLIRPRSGSWALKQRKASRQTHSSLLLTLVLAGGVAGCHGDGRTQQDSQVIATVNGREITISQLNQLLQNVEPAAVTPAVTRQAMDSLVSEELMVQDAIRNKLDRDPAVVQAIERARRQVLLAAFAERSLYPHGPITATEISKYYLENPILFEHRKRFHLTTFLVDAAAMDAELRSALAQTHAVESVRAVLDGHEAKYITQVVRMSPDQFPVDKLPALSDASAGDLLMAEQSDGQVLLMAISSIEDDTPVQLERAKPIIEQFLTLSRNKRALDEYLERTKASSRISYSQHAPAPDTRPSGTLGGSEVTATLGHSINKRINGLN